MSEWFVIWFYHNMFFFEFFLVYIVVFVLAFFSPNRKSDGWANWRLALLWWIKVRFRVHLLHLLCFYLAYGTLVVGYCYVTGGVWKSFQISGSTGVSIATAFSLLFSKLSQLLVWGCVSQNFLHIDPRLKYTTFCRPCHCGLAQQLSIFIRHLWRNSNARRECGRLGGNEVNAKDKL